MREIIITGDCHGNVLDRLENIALKLDIKNPENYAVVILGDAGLNFWLNSTEAKKKKAIELTGFRVYCVRGNHEERPQNLGYDLQYDEEVRNYVFFDSVTDSIRYFIDGGIYNLMNHTALIIGGAYSVDKNYRLQRAGLTEKNNDPKKSGWFKDEQLTAVERGIISRLAKGKEFDFVLTHTAPVSYEPTDLFLNFIDQSTVDKTMEIWLEEIKNSFDWKVWCFGHYHADRSERPCVEMFYQDFEHLEDIFQRWAKYNKGAGFIPHRTLAPNFLAE